MRAHMKNECQCVYVADDAHGDPGTIKGFPQRKANAKKSLLITFQANAEIIRLAFTTRHQSPIVGSDADDDSMNRIEMNE